MAMAIDILTTIFIKKGCDFISLKKIYSSQKEEELRTSPEAIPYLKMTQ